MGVMYLMAPPLALHGNGRRSGQRCKDRIAHIDDGQLSVFVHHRHQIAEPAFCLVADKAVVTMLRQIVMQGTPVFEQLVAERLAVQSVDNDSVKGIATFIVACHNDGITIRSAEDMG